MANGFYHNTWLATYRCWLGLGMGLGISLALVGCGQKGDLYLPEHTSATLTTADPTTQPVSPSLADNPNVTYQNSAQSGDPASVPAATPTTSANPLAPTMIQDDRNAY